MPNISFSLIILATKNAFAAIRNEGGLDDLSCQFSKFIKSRFIRDVTIVAGGTAAAQAITVAFSPIITRLYGPEAFGILGVFLAIIAMITPVASLAYVHAIVLPASDNDARALVKLSLMIAVGIAIVLVIVFGVFHHQIANLFGFDASTLYLILVPIVSFFTVAEQALNQWLIRKKQFRSLSGVAVAQAAAVNVSKAGFGLILATAPILLVLNAIGHGFHAFLLWIGARSTLFCLGSQENESERGQKAPLKTVAYTYRDFPYYRSPGLILNGLSQNIPAVILAAFFGPVPAGFFALTRRVLILPRTLISQSVGKVFLPKIAEAAQRGLNLRPYILKATGGLALFGLMPFGIVIAFGPELFAFVFGIEWITAGEYARWIAIWLYFGFINVPCVQAIPLLGLQRHLLIYEILVAVARAGTLIFGSMVLKSDIKAIILFSVAGALFYVGLIFCVLLNSNKPSRESLV